MPEDKSLTDDGLV